MMDAGTKKLLLWGGVAFAAWYFLIYKSSATASQRLLTGPSGVTSGQSVLANSGPSTCCILNEISQATPQFNF